MFNIWKTGQYVDRNLNIDHKYMMVAVPDQVQDEILQILYSGISQSHLFEEGVLSLNLKRNKQCMSHIL